MYLSFLCKERRSRILKRSTRYVMKRLYATIRYNKTRMDSNSSPTSDFSPLLHGIPKDLQHKLDQMKACLEDIRYKIKYLNRTENTDEFGDIHRDLEYIAKSSIAIKEDPEWDDENSILLDIMDEQGVELWNASKAIIAIGNMETHEDLSENSRRLFAHVREVSYLMVKAGAGVITSLDELGIWRLLSLCSIVGKSWLDADDVSKADDALSEALQIETTISRIKNKNATGKTRAIGTMTLCMYRLEAAFKQSNFHLAKFLCEKITDDHLLSTVTTKEIDHLLHLCFKIGCKLLHTEQGEQAIVWLQHALELLVRKNDTERNCKTIKMRILKALVLAHLAAGKIDKSHYNTADNIVEKLLQEDPHNCTFHLLKMNVWKEKQAPVAMLIEAYYKVMSECDLDDKSIDSFIKVIMFVKDYGNIDQVIHGIDMILNSNFPRRTTNLSRFLLVKFHLLANATLSDPDTVMNVLKAGMNGLLTFVRSMSKNESSACQLVLWQAGDRNQERNPRLASIFYEVAEAFLTENDVNLDILYRKQSLCYLYQGQFDKADEMIAKTNLNALSYFITFHIMISRDDDPEKIASCMKTMCEASDFSIDMLLSCASTCSQKHNKPALLECLKLMLTHKTYCVDSADELSQLVLLRCLIRMTISSYFNQTMDELIPCTIETQDTICGYIETSAKAIHNLCTTKIPRLEQLAQSELFKEVEWLSNTTWNLGIQACEKWETTSTIRLFDILDELFQLYPESIDSINRRSASVFVGMAARMTMLNCEYTQSKKDELCIRILKSASDIKSLVEKSVKLDSNYTHDSPLETLVLLFEFECKVGLGRFDELAQTINETTIGCKLPIIVYERMADILLNRDNTCPSTVVFVCLQALLNSILSNSAQIDHVRFARWFRIMIRTMIVSNRQAVLDILSSAITVLKEDSSRSYPQDEIEWLIVTMWNEGVELSIGNDFDNARVWCEAGLSFLPYFENSTNYEAKMQQAYSEILQMHNNTKSI